MSLYECLVRMRKIGNILCGSIVNPEKMFNEELKVDCNKSFIMLIKFMI